MRARTERHTERRILVAAMRQASDGRTRATSPRQLPTDHDHVGGPLGSIHEYQSDQPSRHAARFSLGSSPRSVNPEWGT
jgi:hypothetical protein